MEKTKHSELVLHTKLMVIEKKGITINDQPLEMYDKEDLKYVESKVMKAMNEEKKNVSMSTTLFFLQNWLRELYSLLMTCWKRCKKNKIHLYLCFINNHQLS